MLNKQSENIGGQSLLIYDYKKGLKKNSATPNKYLVETILLDDIVDFLPIDKKNKTHKRAILKIGINLCHTKCILYSLSF